jgi:regulator of sigma E protease
MLDFLLGNDTLSAIVAFGLVLIPAIIIHELGHFLAAKAVGITILEFGIGFPPRMLTLFTHRGTEYTLNWLPIGGFVRPLGEDFVRPVSDDETEKDRQALKARSDDRSQRENADALHNEREMLRARGVEKIMSVNEARPLARIIFMAAGSTANLLTAMLLFMFIGLSGLPTVVGSSAGIVGITPGTALAEAGLQVGDVITTTNGEYFPSATAFQVRLEELAGQPVTLEVQRAGGDETITLTFTPTRGDLGNYVFVSGIADGSPAAEAGLQPGDVIIGFDGERLQAFEDLPTRTQARLGETVTLTVERGVERLDVTLIPRTDPPLGQGAMGIVIQPAYTGGGSGLTFVDGGWQQSVVALSLGDSVTYGFERIAFFLRTLASLPGELISGAVSPEEARIVSPLGISQFGAVFLQQSIEENQPVVILNYIAIISIALGITNLLPLPALDGGRILFVLLEIIRGRPIAPEREGLVHLVGMALLLSLLVVAFVNDILNPITDLLP